MTRQREERAPRPAMAWRTALTAGLVALLVTVVPGVSWAAWTASDSAASTAQAASVGITQQLTGSTLDAFSYSSTTTRGVATVTITNTSTREGSYTLGLSAIAAPGTVDAAAFLAAVSVEIGTSGSCTTSATLASPVAGTLAATTSYTGTLAAGASAVLCVRTTMTSADITTHADKQLSGTIGASIAVGTWAASATPAGFAQSVEAAPTEVFFVNSAPRYNILNSNTCVGGSGSTVARNGVCDMWNGGQYRIAATGDGAFHISRAVNSTSQPSDPRWSLATAAGTVQSVAPSSAATQRWTITQRPDGTYRIQNVQHNVCATVSSSGNRPIVGAACNDALASQGFTFGMIGNPLPSTPNGITCVRNSGGYVNLTWPDDPEYRQEVSYRVRVEGILVIPHYLHFYTATAHLAPAELQSAGVPYGATRQVSIEQSIGGSGWATVAQGTISYVAPGVVACG